MLRKKWMNKAAGVTLTSALLFTSLPSFAVLAQAAEGTGIPVLSATALPFAGETGYNGERRINFNENWRFQRETNGAISGAQAPGFDDSSWRKLNLPHDWSIELDFNPSSPATHEGGFLDGGIGWYRKAFTLPASMAGQRISIDFDGVYMNSTVYLNGQLLGNYPYGYNAFSYDLTDKLYTDGRENVLAVKVNNTQPSSRWYSGSGIYRDVHLTVTNPIHVARYGTYVTTPNLETAYAAGRADVNIKTKVNNKSRAQAEVKVKSMIYNEAGTVVSTIESAVQTAAADSVTSFEDNAVISNPILWSTDNPHRYKLVTEVMVDGKIADTYETKFGVRYFEFDSSEGFSLNGKYMKLHGASMHHDLGALGAATNYRAVERQMQIMKDMGVNAIRVTHNPASPELLEVCNNLGLLVIEEAFDAWKQSKKTYDYARFFSAWSDRFASTWAEHDIKEMVDRGKNEPAIIMWSLGNEIYDTSTAGAAATARSLVSWVKEIDKTRPTTIGQNSIGNLGAPNANIKAVLDEVDVVGMNYAENNYTNYRNLYPNWKLYGSETSSATRSRGVYTHPYSNNKMTTYPDYQQSSYDNDSVSWGRTAEDAWKRDRDLKHVAGQFIWTGFDYIGEPTPYYNSFPAKSSYFGAVDTAGFPKDVFYYYQSQWKQEPMVHLLPHWNWKEGEPVRVLAYTNAKKVELLLNGVSLGERSYENKKTSWGAPYKETTEGKTYLEWAVPFAPGTLEAVAKDDSGAIIARDKVVTAGKPAAVRLSADRPVIAADGKDLSFVTADIVDSEGNVVPTASNNIQFHVSGNGELAGVDNGDAASVERYKDNKRKAFSGKALAILQSGKEQGQITLTASASGLAGDTVRVFTVQNGEQEQPHAVGFDLVHVVTAVNEAPSLPATVKIYYSDTSSVIKQVTWTAVEPSLYAKIGTFAVEGTVEGIRQKVKATVTVKGLIGIKPVSVVTSIGVLPQLPAQATLLYSDETTRDVRVTWDVITPEQVSAEGSFTVAGGVEGTTIKATAYVRVTKESQRVNIMQRQSGSSYPQLEATYTGTGDNLNHINDGIKSYNNSPKNRWTNWTNTPRNEGDAITVHFGQNYTINNMDLYVFTDFGTVVPNTVKVQYWNGTAWADVSNQTQPSPYVVQKNEIRFDPVVTDKLKFHITPSQAGKHIALTEVEVYANKLTLGSTAKLSGIKVNGLPLEGFNPDQFNYELNLPYGSKIPEVTAQAGDHATVTVMPAFSLPGAVKMYVTSENGLIHSEYVVQMSAEEAKLITAKLSADQTDIVEDDVIELQVTGKLESGEEVDLTGAGSVYSFDSAIIRIEDSKLYALSEGQVKVKADVTYKGVTVTTPELAFRIAKNTNEKVIERLEPVTVIVSPGVAPKLPETVVAHYNEGLPRDINVNWDTVNPAQYEHPGQFTVQGSVAGTQLRAQAKVIVKGALAAANVSMAVLRHQVPALPQKLTVFFSDGTEEEMNVTWAAIPSGSLETIGTFVLEGSIEGVGLKASASIRVTDEIGDEQNISKTKNGYDYPKAEASFTNRGPSSNDLIEAINDDVISYTEEPHNRWTNWQRTPRAGDWVSITFGDFGPVEYDVDNLEVHWFGDHGTSYPASYKIQYKSGDSWVDVTNLRKEPTSPVLGRANVHTFDRVRTSALRVDMTAQPGMSLAITELRVFAKWPKAFSEPKAADIQLDGKSILGAFTPTGSIYEYTAVVKRGEGLPVITASGQDNTSITIVPSVTAPSTAKVIAKSENGKKTAVYNIHFKLDEGTPQPITVSLTGPSKVQTGDPFHVEMGLKHIKSPIQAQDITLRYDANTIEFVDAESTISGIQILVTDTKVPGKVRLIAASTGADHAIHKDGAFFTTKWRAKEMKQKVSSQVETMQAVVSDGTGAETNAALSTFAFDITPIDIPGNSDDVNGDGKVSIGDLAIIASHYGKSAASPDWQQAKRADVNGDGQVDIVDLSTIARKILSSL